MANGEQLPGAADRDDDDVRELLDWAVDQLPVTVALLDRDLRQLRLNAAMCRTIGLKTAADGLGLRLTDLASLPWAREAVRLARQVVDTGKPTMWKGGSRGVAWEVSYRPVLDPAGRVRGVLAVGLDVTDRERARDRLALLNEASSRIGSTLDMTVTVRELAEVAVPRLADYAMVDLLESVLHGDEPNPGPVPGTVALRRMTQTSILKDTPEALFRLGEVTSYPEDSPIAGCLATGRGARYPGPNGGIDQWYMNDPARAVHFRRYAMHSTMVVPIRARGITLGVATFIRHRRQEPFGDDDLVLAGEIVAQAAISVDNARRYTRERDTALTLQRSLLPRRLPAQRAVQVATRYLPAGSAITVGGDWFDVIRLSGSRVGMVVGDVVGHGVRAAATMGRLRTAVRTLADVDLEPDELLTRLDDVVIRLAEEEEPLLGGDVTATDLTATCLYAIYDPVSRRCTMARAGHPLPAIVTPERGVEYPDLPAGPPLGLGGLPFEQAEIELPEDSLLVLYTDGLIESRQRDIGTGLDQMREVLSHSVLPAGGTPDAARSLETICDNLVEYLLPGGAEDDAALLVASTRALAADRIASWELPAEPAVVANARAWATRKLADWRLDEIAFTTELIVSELVTNAIRYGQPPIQLRMILDDTLSCEVSDATSTAPHLRRADRYDEGGRGLMLVAQLTDRWGTRHTRGGKTIWAQQPLPGDVNGERRADRREARL